MQQYDLLHLLHIFIMTVSPSHTKVHQGYCNTSLHLYFQMQALQTKHNHHKPIFHTTKKCSVNLI